MKKHTSKNPKSKIRKNPKFSIDEIVHQELSGLQGPYYPASETCPVLNTIVPDTMDYETHIIIRKIRHIIGMPIQVFVADRLKYKPDEMCRALSAEQVDAIALAIYNIEYKNEGIIIGDQTGIGKGRVAAAMIRYGCIKGLQPIFLSEKPNLFSDIYRDLVAIGSDNLVPFIINTKEAKTDIKDPDGNIVYQSLSMAEQTTIFQSKKVPKRFDWICGTYSQFNSAEKKPTKPQFLSSVANDNLLIMDEAHNASGSSQTGAFMQAVVQKCRGVVFLSATFSKRPDNMPIYAMKTAMKDANLSNDELVSAIINGGVALQEVLSAQLVSEGQMIRREYSYEGVEVNYIYLDEKAEEHRAVADNITAIIRDIIKFQSDHVNPVIKNLDKIAVAEGEQVKERQGTSKAGVDNSPYFSKVFNVINQMLFSIKAVSVAEKAISRLKEGKKPIIAFSSTMGAFLDSMENDKGDPVQPGDVLNADFKEVLYRGLNTVLKYTVTTVDGRNEKKMIEMNELPREARDEYMRIHNQIDVASSGISISPIDVIIHTIEKAGYTVAEVTGRASELQMRENGSGVYQSRKKIRTNDAFRMFNNNEVDVLMINQSGSTGASAQAIPTNKVPASQVKQRVMIILQAELNINTEIQKRGRINRTGQIMKPIYDYVISAIPAEKRLMMMLQKKLKSLDANTTSSQTQSSNILAVDDFLNKYGDKIVVDFLTENPEINELLDDPLKLKEDPNDKSEGKSFEDAAHRVSGRVAVLSTEMQTKFYTEIMDRYTDYVTYLRQMDEYDLEVEIMNLDAEIIDRKTIINGKGGGSTFGTDTYLEQCEVNNLRKPFTKPELENLLRESLNNRTPEEIILDLRGKLDEYIVVRQKKEIQDTNTKYDNLINAIPDEKQYKALMEPGKTMYYNQRVIALNTAREEKIKMIIDVLDNHKYIVNETFDFYKPGKAIYYPVSLTDTDVRKFPAMFLGYQIDYTKPNPFTLGNIKLRFAIAGSVKYVVLNMSKGQGEKLASIQTYSRYFNPTRDEFFNDWPEYIKTASADRTQRYIITGNLLQAMSKYKGKLISYSLKGGGTAKGILMPDKWEQSQQSSKVVVPIIKAYEILANMKPEDKYLTTNAITIDKHNPSWSKQGDYGILLPRSKAYGELIKDPEIISFLNDRSGFMSRGNLMYGTFDSSMLKPIIAVLQKKYNVSIEISQETAAYYITAETVNSRDKFTIQAEQDLEHDIEKFAGRQLPGKKPKSEINNPQPEMDIDELELIEAEALAKIKILQLQKF